MFVSSLVVVGVTSDPTSKPIGAASGAKLASFGEETGATTIGDNWPTDPASDPAAGIKTVGVTCGAAAAVPCFAEPPHAELDTSTTSKLSACLGASFTLAAGSGVLLSVWVRSFGVAPRLLVNTVERMRCRMGSRRGTLAALQLLLASVARLPGASALLQSSAHPPADLLANSNKETESARSIPANSSESLHRWHGASLRKIRQNLTQLMQTRLRRLVEDDKVNGTSSIDSGTESSGSGVVERKFRRDDIRFATAVHNSPAPVARVGLWVRANQRDWLTTGHTDAHLKCLNQEFQGNCYANGGQGSYKSSRYNFMHRAGSHLKNSQGALVGRVDYAWREHAGSEAAGRLYREWSGPPAALRSELQHLLGADGRVIVYGDSLSRQLAKTLECTFTHKLNITGRVVFRQWNLGGRLGQDTRPSDFFVLNFGHHLDHGAGDGSHRLEKRGWTSAFADLEKKIEAKEVTADRVFVRTTQVRFIRRDSPGDWNTTAGMLCGELAPTPSATWSQYGGQNPSLPAQNLVLLELLDSTPYQVLDLAPISLARADLTFDCSHNCLPGVQDTWASVLAQRMINTVAAAPPALRTPPTSKTAANVPSAPGASSTLVYRAFPTWEAYYAWRDTQSGWQPVHPCVPNPDNNSYKCLPKLIVIGAFKGGTTGLRYKLLASKQFFGPTGENHYFAEKEKSTTVPRAVEAAKYAMVVSRAVFLQGNFVVFEDNPRYIDELNTNMLEFIRKVNPDAVMLLLARPGADIWFSGLEMGAAAHKDCAEFRPYGDDCATATAHTAAQAHKVFNEGKGRAIAMESEWARRNVISLRERAGIYVAKGGYVYALRHLWHTWPRAQTLILESTAVWAKPRESYNALAHALKLNFTINLVEGTRTRPESQDHPMCPKAKFEAWRRLISECDLKMPFRCAWHSANILLADLLNVSWPIAWNDNVTASTCEPYNFTALDLRARFFAHSSLV